MVRVVSSVHKTHNIDLTHFSQGKKRKKPFINKKEAQTYSLVSRSHHDPLAGDVDESQNVLKPQDNQVSII